MSFAQTFRKLSSGILKNISSENFAKSQENTCSGVYLQLSCEPSAYTNTSWWLLLLVFRKCQIVESCDLTREKEQMTSQAMLHSICFYEVIVVNCEALS